MNKYNENKGKLILLDRDGVLNEMVINRDHGTIDSPLHPDQVRIMDEVPNLLKLLNDSGFGLAIVSNQPAYAKGKTTKSNLENTHRKIVEEIESEGAKILSSHLCFHRQEDNCECRKPKPGLLLDAISLNSYLNIPIENSNYISNSLIWMVGDGVTDVQAGKAIGLKTAFLGPKKCDACKIFDNFSVRPDFWGKSLNDFVEHLKLLS